MKTTELQDGSFIRHTGIYLIARGLPGIFAFLSIPLFTRLLDPAGYGKYALVMAAAAMINAILFAWIPLGMVRFLPAYRRTPGPLKSTLLTVSLLLVVITTLSLPALWLIPALYPWRSMALGCWLLLATQIPFDLFQEYLRAQILPWRFMGLQFARAFLGTFLGAALIKLGVGWWGAAAGLAVGMFLPCAITLRSDWSDARLVINRALLQKVARYAIPLSITLTLASVIGSSDRFLIAWLKGDAPAGLYSVACDLTNRTLFLFMNVVNLAMYPLAIRAWEDHGREAAQQQMRHNAALLMAVGLPSVVGMTILAGSISYCFLGESFRHSASQIIPLVAVGAFLSGFKAFHWDAAFQFVHQTIHQVWIVLIVAVINLGLNIVFIPHFGINGAAVASVIAYIVSIVLTAVIGRRHFALPMPLRPLAQVVVATAVMTLCVWPLRSHRGLLALSLQGTIGACVYAIVLVSQNFLDLRTALLRKRNSAPARLDESALLAPEVEIVGR